MSDDAMTATHRDLSTREGNVEEIIDEMRGTYVIDEGLFSSLGMMITDSLLNRDTAALRAAHDGLRRLYGHHPNSAHKGRFLGQIDVTYWALRRIG